MNQEEKTKYYETVSRLSDVFLLKEYTDVFFDGMMNTRDDYDNFDKLEICRAEIFGRMLPK